MKPHNIIIGKPIIDLKKLGIEDYEKTIKDKELFLPKLLKKHGFFKSTSQIKKNRPELWRELEELSTNLIKVGKDRVYIVVGEL